MKDTNFEQAAGTQDGGQPKPWDREPGEPVDCYYWFRIYLAQPIPRKVAQVARLIGTNSERTYLTNISHQWRWKERAVCFDADKAQQIVIQFEARNQRLLDEIFHAQFQGLLDTTQAIQNAELDRMDRDEARGHLAPLTQHQRGLLRIVMQQVEQAAEDSLEERNEDPLAQLVEERALAMVKEWEREGEERLKLFWGSDEESPETCADPENDG